MSGMFRGMVVDSGASGELVIKIPTTRSTSRFSLSPSSCPCHRVNTGAGINEPGADAGACSASELRPLMGGSGGHGDPLPYKKKNADGVTACCACSAAAMVLSIVTVIALCAAIYIRLDSTLTSVEEQVSPHASTMLQSTVSILVNAKNATDSLSKMGRNTETLVKTSVPKLVAMLNSTHVMLERVQQFAKKPSISIGPSAFLNAGS